MLGQSYSDTWFESPGSFLRGHGSFPSGHAIAAFSVATIAARRSRNRKWIPYAAYGLPGAVAFSRHTLLAHFVSDVFVGAFLAIRSAGSLFFANSKPALLAALALCTSLSVPGQLTTGIVEGILHDSQGHPVSGGSIAVTGGAGFRLTIHTNADGKFTATLPYGKFQFSGVPVFVAPLQTSNLDLTIGASGTEYTESPPGLWSDSTGARVYPEAFSLTAVLLSREPSSVTEPLNFTGLSDNRLGIESQRGISWTDTRYTLQGIDASDSYQPGLPMILPNIEAIQDIVVRSTFSQSPSDNAGTGVGLFLAEAGTAWHAALSSMNTGSPLSSTNLPAADRVLLEQRDHFKWLTRDGLEIGGPIGNRADLFASAWGQWGSQTQPLQAPGNDQRSRLLFANTRGRIRLTDRDQFEALYVGSRVDLSNGGIPTALEALTGNRMAPSFTLPGGFPNQPEVDHLDFVQTAWTHESIDTSRLGTIQVRYGYSTAHLDALLPAQVPGEQQSRIELLTGVVIGAPPLGNLAIRTRQSIESGWQPATFSTWSIHHRITAGGGWTASSPRNRFTAPSNMNLITANGVPAFVVDFNTPADATAFIRSFSGYITDRVNPARGLSLDFGGLLEFSRGSVPGQSGNLIAWHSLSPRTGLAWGVPHSHGVVLLTAYSRPYSPLAGRYLDFGNPASLSGSEYQWIDRNSNGWLDPGE